MVFACPRAVLERVSRVVFVRPSTRGTRGSRGEGGEASAEPQAVVERVRADTGPAEQRAAEASGAEPPRGLAHEAPEQIVGARRKGPEDGEPQRHDCTATAIAAVRCADGDGTPAARNRAVATSASCAPAVRR